MFNVFIIGSDERKMKEHWGQKYIHLKSKHSIASDQKLFSQLQ